MTEAKAALSLDAENKEAESVLAQAKAGASAQKTPAQGLQDSWKDVSQRYFVPLTALAVPIAALLAVLVVFARLLVLWVRKWPTLHTDAGGGRLRLLWCGLIAMVIAATVFTLGFAAPITHPGWLFSVTTLPGLSMTLITAIALFTLGEDVERRTDHKLVRQFLGFGFIAAASASLIPVLKSVGMPLPPGWSKAALLLMALLLLAAIAGAVGIFLLSWWLATRLSVEVRVSASEDTDKPADVGLVVAMLNELGAAPPKGLEVPRGSDVTALEGALLPLPENALAKAVTKLAVALGGATPWQARIEGNGTSHSVNVYRNGRIVGAAVIDAGNLGLTSPSPDANTPSQALPDARLRMASAFILATLATEHPSIRKGLVGATDWRSIGLQYVATTVLTDNTKKQKTLASAVKYDPGNKAAELAYRHTLARKSTDLSDLVEYRDWLKSFEYGLDNIRKALQSGNDQLDEAELAEAALILRACYTRTAIATNAVFASHTDDVGESQTASRTKAVEAISALRILLDDLSSHRDALGPLYEQIDDHFKDVEPLLQENPPDLQVPAPSSPARLYNQACYYASRRSWCAFTGETANGASLEDIEEDDLHAVRLLRAAIVEPSNAAWMREDPQLELFRRRFPYKKGFLSEPRADFYALSAVKPYAEPLRSAGYGQVELVAALFPNPQKLLFVIPGESVVREAIVNLAHLQSSFTGELAAQNWGLEMLERLTQMGIATERSLRTISDRRLTDIAKSIASDLVKSYKPVRNVYRLSAKDADTKLAGKVEEIIIYWFQSLRQDSSKNPGSQYSAQIWDNVLAPRQD
jgi:hypothetical protein